MSQRHTASRQRKARAGRGAARPCSARLGSAHQPQRPTRCRSVVSDSRQPVARSTTRGGHIWRRYLRRMSQMSADRAAIDLATADGGGPARSSWRASERPPVARTFPTRLHMINCPLTDVIRRNGSAAAPRLSAKRTSEKCTTFVGIQRSFR